VPIVVETDELGVGTLQPKAPTDAFVVGPHSLFVRNGITFNDRDELECYWVEEPTGFGRADVRATAEENSQEDGETALPSFYGGRVMTLSGWIRCGDYPRLLTMTEQLEDSLADLSELPMTIKVREDSIFFSQPPVQIDCRVADWDVVRKLQPTDNSGLIRRNFTVALRASSPRYLSEELHELMLVPSSINLLGRDYPRSYDLAYDVSMDASGNPAINANTRTLHNAGNWPALPLIRFNGPMAGAILTNETNGHVIKLREQLQVGDWIEIDSATGTVVDQLGNNRFSARDSSSDWMRFQAKRGSSSGDNKLILSVDSFGSGSGVDLIWRDTWIGG
jgi:hypothetical protein